jgi:hypothetical protein
VVSWGSPMHATAKAAELAVLLRTKAGYYDVSDPATAVTGSSARLPSPSSSPSPSPSGSRSASRG